MAENQTKPNHIEQPNVFFKLDDKLEEFMYDLSSESRTANYVGYVELVKDFFNAEKTEDFYLYLITLRRMTTPFATIAHMNSVKCERIYLLPMWSYLKVYK